MSNAAVEKLEVLAIEIAQVVRQYVIRTGEAPPDLAADIEFVRGSVLVWLKVPGAEKCPYALLSLAGDVT